MFKKANGICPTVDPNAIILEPSTIVGDVHIGPESSVWFGAVIRGDAGKVRIGARSNVQDNVVIHESNQRSSVTIEDEVTIGHGAIIHGATLKRRCLIGMGAIILDNAVIGENCMIGAGALVPEGMIVPDGHLAVGIPARVIRPLKEEEIAGLEYSAQLYVDYAKQMREEEEL